MGIIVRLPLGSGLLGGKITRGTSFRHDDHRHFNRDRAAFNLGETFAGRGQERGVDASERVAALVPPSMNMAPLSPELHAALAGVYREHVREHIRGPY